MSAGKAMRRRLVAYNLGPGGGRAAGVGAAVFAELAPDLLFVQESREPAIAWLPAAPEGAWLWAPVAELRWGSGLWVRAGGLTPLAVPEPFAGWVAAARVEGLTWPGIGRAPVVALSIHAPTRPGRSYIAEVGRILDLAPTLAGGLPLILGGDFNVVVGCRGPDEPVRVTPGERALLTRLRDELGLVPCWQTAHPGTPLARTLRWRQRIDSLPYHCDGLFIPAAWAGALESCRVVEDAAWLPRSDHNPVVAVLRVD